MIYQIFEDQMQILKMFIINWIETLRIPTALVIHPLMVPARAAPMPNLPLFRIIIATLKPPPSSVNSIKLLNQYDN
jgi:hypothetical protein